MESGQPVPEPVSVGLSCGMRSVQVIYSDLKGDFQFVLGAGFQSNTDMSASNDSSISPVAGRTNLPDAFASFGGSGQRLLGCELQVSVPGYQPLTKTITDPGEIGVTDAGTLVLRRIAGVRGSAISVTSLLVPKNARKEFDQGDKETRSHDLDSATQHLEKAVAEYDKYAAAWNELGTIYSTRHQVEKARQAYEKAMTADPQYVPPYVNLAALELQEGQFESAGETAGKALELDPGTEVAGFLQAAANFKLNRLDAAEQCARDAEARPHQNIPQLHVLLADIYLRKQDYSNAVAQMQVYLKEAPQGKFAGEIKKRLEQIEKSAANVGSTPSSPEEQPQPPLKSQASSSTQKGSAVLEVCLRMQDDSPFTGSATVRVMPTEGYEVVGTPSGSDGETIFANMLPGTYTVEASAPGYLAIRKQTNIEAGSRLHTLFLVMKPRPLPASAAQLSVPTLTPVAAANSKPTPWIPPDIDRIVPSVEAGVECSLPQVISGAGRRMKQLVENLQKFNATEHVEHFNVDATGSHGKPETRNFDYVATVTLSDAGVFLLDEYRNGSVAPSQFPAQIATTGLPAMALIFHPTQVSDFNLTCEGLGQWDGRPAWQVHFAQRADRSNRIRAYVIGQNYYPVPLKGRVWIDEASYQVLRLESESMKPVQEIALTQEYMAIDYGPVQFQTHKQQLWLPLDAEVYWERRGRRFYRRHTFGNFKVFEVESAQQIQDPKESYCFTNTSDHDIAGILTVSPVAGIPAKAVSIQLTIRAGRRVCKLVGPGKDVSIPVDEVGSATFMHNGLAGSITADATLIRESTLDLVP